LLGQLKIEEAVDFLVQLDPQTAAFINNGTIINMGEIQITTSAAIPVLNSGDIQCNGLDTFEID